MTDFNFMIGVLVGMGACWAFIHYTNAYNEGAKVRTAVRHLKLLRDHEKGNNHIMNSAFWALHELDVDQTKEFYWHENGNIIRHKESTK